MGPGDEYRHNARRCLELADTVSDADNKASLFQIAHGWLLLAEEAKKNSAADGLYAKLAKMAKLKQA
jgi:hypothetical protein